ncbi:MAG: carboxypeptidase regulatory-like domain-containing protein [Sandaracinaceae bacterium]
MRRAAIGTALLLAGFPGGFPRATAQPTVRVRAETRIELRIDRSPGLVLVSGVLRDDLGAPLPDRAARLRLADERGMAVGSARRSTGSDGSFAAGFDVDPGSYEVRATFAGDEVYRGIEAVQRLDLDRAHVRLDVEIRAGGRLDLTRPTHVVEVTAVSDEGGGGLDVQLDNELGRRLAAGRTDGGGRLRFTVASDELGPPSTGRLIARTAGDDRRSSAQTEVPITRFRPTRLSLDWAGDSVARTGDSLEVEGLLDDAAGPLARKAVGLFLDGEHVATLLTDQAGRFRGELDAPPTPGEVEVGARYEADAPWRTDGEADALTLTVLRRTSTPWLWLMVPVVLSAAGFVVLSRRRRGATARAAAAPAVRRPGIDPGERRSRAPGSTRIDGTVLDVDTGRPLDGAQVVLEGPDPRGDTTGEDGAFVFREVAAGTHRLRALAPGYAATAAQVRVPHRGEWSPMTVRLQSLRELAVATYRPVAERLAPGRGFWALFTPRELQERAPTRARPPLSALTRRLEEAAYGRRPPALEDVEGVRRAADEVAAALEEGEPDGSR